MQAAPSITHTLFSLVICIFKTIKKGWRYGHPYSLSDGRLVMRRLRYNSVLRLDGCLSGYLTALSRDTPFHHLAAVPRAFLFYPIGLGKIVSCLVIHISCREGNNGQRRGYDIFFLASICASRDNKAGSFRCFYLFIIQ